MDGTEDPLCNASYFDEYAAPHHHALAQGLATSSDAGTISPDTPRRALENDVSTVRICTLQMRASSDAEESH